MVTIVFPPVTAVVCKTLPVKFFKGPLITFTVSSRLNSTNLGTAADRIKRPEWMERGQGNTEKIFETYGKSHFKIINVEPSDKTPQYALEAIILDDCNRDDGGDAAACGVVFLSFATHMSVYATHILFSHLFCR